MILPPKLASEKGALTGSHVPALIRKSLRPCWSLTGGVDRILWLHVFSDCM